MSRTEYRVTVEVRTLDTPDQVLIGKATASALRLSSGRFALRAGSTSRVARVSISDKIGNKSMALSSEIAQELGISSGDVVRVASSQRRLRIGPYVGVLTAPQRKSSIPSRSFGRDTEYLRELCAAGKGLGLIAFVLPYDAVNFRARRVFGRVPEPRRGGKWHIREFPFPDVLFNRIPSRAHERSPQARRVLNYALQQRSVHLFNQGFMDKWSVYAELSRHPDVRHMVPTTARFQGRVMLKSWLRRFGSVYLKPSSGSLGQGIIVVEQTPQGVVCWFRNRRQRPVSERASNVDRIYGRIRQLIAGRSTDPTRSAPPRHRRIAVRRQASDAAQYLGPVAEDEDVREDSQEGRIRLQYQSGRVRGSSRRGPRARPAEAGRTRAEGSAEGRRSGGACGREHVSMPGRRTRHRHRHRPAPEPVAHRGQRQASCGCTETIDD